MPRTRRGHTRSEWSKLTLSVTPDLTKDLPYLEVPRAKLVEIETEVDRLVLERNFYQARKQETTRKLQDALVEGRKVASVLRVGLRHRFGDTNEQLVAFGIKPFRGRKRAKETPSPSDVAGDTGDESPEPSGASST